MRWDWGGVDKWEREERLKRRNCVIVHGFGGVSGSRGS